MEVELPLPGRPWGFRDPLRTPANLRDLAVIAPRDVTYRDLREVLRREGGDLLERVDVFDVYEGPSIPEGQRSLAVRLTYRGARTLQDTDVDPEFARAIDAVRREGWTVRER
nr:hypothetical protein [Deinococcus pimensis]